MRMLAALLVLASCLASAADGQAPVLYGSDISSLGIIDRATGAWTPIGSHGVVITGLGWNGATNVLYGMSPSNNALYTINQATGAATIVGPTGFNNVNTVTWVSSNNTLYGADLNTRAFFSVNPATGAGTLVGTYNAGMSIEGLAYDPATDMVYGLEDNTDRIVVIDKATGLATPLPSAIGISGISRGLDFDTQLGVIWATTVNPGRLIRVNPVTGVGTLVSGAIPTFVQSIAFKDPLGLATQYQVNQPQASVNVNGVLGTSLSPAVVNLALNQVGLASASSTLAGNLYEIGLGAAPLIPVAQGALLTADGQVLNLDLADPSLTLVFGGFQSPPFASFVAPLSSSVALAASFQMAVLDPSAPSALRLSQPVRLLIQ